MTQPVVFIDTETTGLDPNLRLPWEIAMIRVDDDGRSEEHFYVDVPMERADPFALRVGHFYDRHPKYAEAGADARLVSTAEAAILVETWTRGATLVGAVPSFDVWTLDPLLRAHHLLPAWHYQPVDVETLAVGYLLGCRTRENRGDRVRGLPALPWDSEVLSRLIDVEPDLYDRHTALGDARWTEAMWEAMYEHEDRQW